VLYDDLSTELVPFQFPKYLAYEIDAAKLTVKDINDFKKEIEQSGDHYRIVLTGDKAKVQAVDKERLQLVGIDVKTKEDKIERKDIEQSVVAFTDNSLIEAFAEFCCRNELNGSEGIEYLKKALC
jgi:predicted metalloenzyme YecM